MKKQMIAELLRPAMQQAFAQTDMDELMMEKNYFCANPSFAKKSSKQRANRCC